MLIINKALFEDGYDQIKQDIIFKYNKNLAQQDLVNQQEQAAKEEEIAKQQVAKELEDARIKARIKEELSKASGLDKVIADKDKTIQDLSTQVVKNQSLADKAVQKLEDHKSKQKSKTDK